MPVFHPHVTLHKVQKRKHFTFRKYIRENFT